MRQASRNPWPPRGVNQLQGVNFHFAYTSNGVELHENDLIAAIRGSSEDEVGKVWTLGLVPEYAIHSYDTMGTNDTRLFVVTFG